jgi:hypothetical protein
MKLEKITGCEKCATLPWNIWEWVSLLSALKPEFIGKNVHSHHKKAASNEKLDLMLQEFEKGRTEPFHYGARPYGKAIVVTLSPILKDGEFVGCVQSVMLKEDAVAEA